jgi:hypothetical protein
MEQWLNPKALTDEGESVGEMVQMVLRYYGFEVLRY